MASPGGTGHKPKVDFYVSTHLLAQATVLPAFFDRPDVITLNVFGVDLFGKSFSHFRILNLYNLWTKRTWQMTVSPLVAFSENLLPHPCREGLQHPPPSACPFPLPLRGRTCYILSIFFQVFRVRLWPSQSAWRLSPFSPRQLWLTICS